MITTASVFCIKGWLLYAKYQDKGFTKTKTNLYNNHGEIKTTMLTVWTEKGREFIHCIVTGNNDKGPK
ncbi:phage antirepressor KilAC domain-containing protein [Carboxylicivirga sp. RSCT41]|uniref:phage antirepressor KilAC domain-containing protein n=1 Tax=Carboxylicivirga agarovorans TaxID=3417570 RepID=UPI003D33C097